MRSSVSAVKHLNGDRSPLLLWIIPEQKRAVAERLRGAFGVRAVVQRLLVARQVRESGAHAASRRCPSNQLCSDRIYESNEDQIGSGNTYKMMFNRVAGRIDLQSSP